MSKLKPCPFCGGEAHMSSFNSAHCKTCNIAIQPEVWNTRPIEECLRADALRILLWASQYPKQVEDLQAELKQLDGTTDHDAEIVRLKRICAAAGHHAVWLESRLSEERAEVARLKAQIQAAKDLFPFLRDDETADWYD